MSRGYGPVGPARQGRRGRDRAGRGCRRGAARPGGGGATRQVRSTDGGAAGRGRRACGASPHHIALARSGAVVRCLHRSRRAATGSCAAGPLAHRISRHGTEIKPPAHDSDAGRQAAGTRAHRANEGASSGPGGVGRASRSLCREDPAGEGARLPVCEVTRNRAPAGGPPVGRLNPILRHSRVPRGTDARTRSALPPRAPARRGQAASAPAAAPDDRPAAPAPPVDRPSAGRASSR